MLKNTVSVCVCVTMLIHSYINRKNNVKQGSEVKTNIKFKRKVETKKFKQSF